MRSRLPYATLCIALGMCGLMTTLATAERPGIAASPGGALAAKAIGLECRVLDATEIGELDAYLALARTEISRRPGALNFDQFVAELYPEYVAKYHDPRACTADAAEEARDTLARVRTAVKTGKLLSD